MTTWRKSIWLTVLAAGVLTASCQSSPRDSTTAAPPVAPPIPLPAPSETKPRDYPGIHNAVAYHENFVSGSAPDGDTGFDTLQHMGVKTIISVDGAVPEVDKAKARGMRYIHLPIGYNGFDEQRKLELVRATSDAMTQGPVYIHCHHGKHRSAGAAACIAASLGWETAPEAVERMKVSGTAPNYTGLYAAASSATMIDATALERLPAHFPEVSKPTGFVQGMIEIDEVTEHLKAIEKSGWQPPPDHPDLVPVAEAGRLADLFRQLRALDAAKRRPPDFDAMMQESNRHAQALEDMLASADRDNAKLSATFKLVAASCKDCHAGYRD
ncbi:MAG: cytochrome c [Planctomycetes bacterium]|nr:cytochrome c [Planctomycetota bacterium]